MDSLTIFGLFAVTAMLVFYALEERNTFYILCFAGACALGSIYGFLQGAWPFGIVEAMCGAERSTRSRTDYGRRVAAPANATRVARGRR